MTHYQKMSMVAQRALMVVLVIVVTLTNKSMMVHAFTTTTTTTISTLAQYHHSRHHRYINSPMATQNRISLQQHKMTASTDNADTSNTNNNIQPITGGGGGGSGNDNDGSGNGGNGDNNSGNSGENGDNDEIDAYNSIFNDKSGKEECSTSSDSNKKNNPLSSDNASSKLQALSATIASSVVPASVENIATTTSNTQKPLHTKKYLQIIKNNLSWYVKALDSHPLITKSITSGFVGMSGDILAQTLEYKRTCYLHCDSEQRKGMNFVYDKRRGFAILIDGLFVSGPIMHLGYDLFERIIPTMPNTMVSAGATAASKNNKFVGGMALEHHHTSSRSLAAILHVIADSVILDSIFIASAITTSDILEGYSLKDRVIPQLKEEYFTVWKASMTASSFMAPLEFAFFRYLPVSMRVLAVSMLDVLWDGMISFMAHRNRHEHHQ